MAKALSKSQLVAAIADKSAASPKKQAGEILDHLRFALAYKHAKDTSSPCTGIGKQSSSRTAPPRMGRNPKTGEAIQIKAKRVVKFRVAKAAKDAINSRRQVSLFLSQEALRSGEARLFLFP